MDGRGDWVAGPVAEFEEDVGGGWVEWWVGVSDTVGYWSMHSCLYGPAFVGVESEREVASKGGRQAVQQALQRAAQSRK